MPARLGPRGHRDRRAIRVSRVLRVRKARPETTARRVHRARQALRGLQVRTAWACRRAAPRVRCSRRPATPILTRRGRQRRPARRSRSERSSSPWSARTRRHYWGTAPGRRSRPAACSSGWTRGMRPSIPSRKLAVPRPTRCRSPRCLRTRMCRMRTRTRCRSVQQTIRRPRSIEPTQARTRPVRTPQRPVAQRRRRRAQQPAALHRCIYVEADGLGFLDDDLALALL